MRSTNRNKLISTLNTLARIIFVLSLVVTAVIVVAHLNATDEEASVLGVKFFSVKTDSMSLPDNAQDEAVFFNAGDVIIVRASIDAYSLNVGDVITFVSTASESFGKTVTHKIREVRYSTSGEVLGYVTYGIKTGASDSALALPESVKGVYLAKIPRLGNVLEFLKSPAGYFMAILAPFMLLLIYLSTRLGYMLASRKKGPARECTKVGKAESTAIALPPNYQRVATIKVITRRRVADRQNSKKAPLQKIDGQ